MTSQVLSLALPESITIIIAIQTYNQRSIQHQRYLSRYRIYDPSVTVYFLPIYAYVFDRLDSVTKNHPILILILSQIIYIVRRDLSRSFNSPYTLSPIKYLSQAYCRANRGRTLIHYAIDIIDFILIRYSFVLHVHDSVPVIHW